MRMGSRLSGLSGPTRWLLAILVCLAAISGWAWSVRDRSDVEVQIAVHGRSDTLVKVALYAVKSDGETAVLISDDAFRRRARLYIADRFLIPYGQQSYDTVSDPITFNAHLIHKYQDQRKATTALSLGNLGPEAHVRIDSTEPGVLVLRICVEGGEYRNLTCFPPPLSEPQFLSPHC